MNKILLLIILILVLALAAVLILFFERGTTPTVSNFEKCVAMGYPILESYPRQCKIPDGQIFTEDIGNELEKTDLIFTVTPRPNQTVSSPLLIEGAARGNWYFEASFPIKIYDSENRELGVAVAQAQDDWMTTDFVPFLATLNFSTSSTQKGKLVLEKDNPSGLLENADRLEIPIVFGQLEETMQIKTYFNNSKLDPEFSCNEVFPVYREIHMTQTVARAALEELLKGTQDRDELLGFLTSINPGVKIQSLTIQEGLARVDFDEQLEFQVGGSCRVSAIRVQITETLKQFPTVDSVIISINGRTEDILQP